MASTFGPVDQDSIVLSMKPPKKAAHKPPKYATAAVPFKTIADAHAAVCASRRADRGLDEFEIGWMGGCEPAVWSWAERMLKSKEEREASASASAAPASVVGGVRGGGGGGGPALSPAGDGARDSRIQDYSGAPSKPVSGSQFSSFPSSFVRIRIRCLLLASPAIPDHHTVWASSSHPLIRTSTLRSWPGFRICCSHAHAASREGTPRARDSRAGGR